MKVRRIMKMFIDFDEKMKIAYGEEKEKQRQEVYYQQRNY